MDCCGLKDYMPTGHKSLLQSSDSQFFCGVNLSAVGQVIKPIYYEMSHNNSEY